MNAANLRGWANRPTAAVYAEQPPHKMIQEPGLLKTRSRHRAPGGRFWSPRRRRCAAAFDSTGHYCGYGVRSVPATSFEPWTL